MNRRELLKALASLPVVTTVGCSTFSSKPTVAPVAFTTMNLVFEGPFIFFMDNPQVRVFAPKVDGHRYLINNANAPESTYMLGGVAGVDDVQQTHYELPSGADAFRLSASQLHLALNNEKAPFFTFVLPAPDRVVALSTRQAEIIDAFGNRRSAVMPTSYAFVYHVTDPSALALIPDTGWNPQAGAVSRFANLAVAAGLPLDAQDPTGQHAHSAFAELKSYFPALSMEVLSTGPEVQSGTVEGLSKAIRRGSMLWRDGAQATFKSAALTSQLGRPRLMNVASLVDCQIGGVIVIHP
ncbi:MAG: hypothetical protein LAO76_23235 [Acidobacteriia bacterium]|nr:hypothetical protein [Terriglobia bacterium]